MYYPNELALKLAEVLGLPKHLIWYELKFSSADLPRVRCELELQEAGNPKVENGKILTVFKEFEIHAEEIKKEDKND